VAGRLKRVKERLARQEFLNHQLQRRVAELEAATVVGDSHNSSLPPSLDPPAARATNVVRRTRSLRRPSGRRPGAQPGHQGHTRPRIEQPERVAFEGLPRQVREPAGHRTAAHQIVGG
jgi:transposase